MCSTGWWREEGTLYEVIEFSISFEDSGSELVSEDWVTDTETLILRLAVALALRHDLTL